MAAVDVEKDDPYPPPPMNDAFSDPTRPVPGQERIQSLDVLRGVALLGILIMNIRSFAMPNAAYLNPHGLGLITGVEWWVWIAGDVLANMKFITIFSALFGAGIVIFTTRAEEKGRSPRALHYRRMTWLLLFGLAHAHLLWSGDVLFVYAVCGMVLYPLRRMNPRRLLILGLILHTVGSALYLLMGWSMSYWPAESIENLTESWAPSSAVLAEAYEAFRGGWLDQMRVRVPESLFFETFYLALHTFWTCTGAMLMGMALFKWGVLSARREDGFYIRCVFVGALVGLPLIIFGVVQNEAVGWDITYSFFTGTQYNAWGAPLLALAYIGLVMLAVRRRIFAGLTRRLAAAGRMAFTNYIAQSVIATTLFYGHGLGLFGSVSFLGQLGFVAAIWVIQLAYSPWWLARFRFGPLEWLWRGLTYGARPSFRRQPSSSGRS